MKNNNKFNLLFRLLNIWFVFNFILYLSSNLPQWGAPNIQNWINVSLYFLLFLFSFTIFLKEKNNKDIFFNLSLLLFVVSISFINFFMGSEYLFGNNKILYYFYEYKQIVFCFLINFVIIYIVMKYLFYKTKPVSIYMLSLGILLPISIYHFFPYLKNPDYIFILGNNYYLKDLSFRLFLVGGITFPFILIYGYILFKKDHSIGEYINELMAFFFIFYVIDSIDKLSVIYNFEVLLIRRQILTLNLLFLTFILFKKMCFLCSDYGQFYESLISQKIDLGKVKIQRRKTERNVLFLKILKIYFTQRRNYLLTLGLMFVIAFLYFRFPNYVTLNIIAFMGCILILFYFIYALYKKRSGRNYTIS